MKYLVTGINGFVAPYLKELLVKEGHEVKGVSRKDIELSDHKGVADLIRNVNFDGVFHLAAQAHSLNSAKMPYKTFCDTALSTINIVDAIENKSHKTKLVYVASGEVYGARQDHITEDKPYAPKNPYSTSKVISELYVLDRTKNDKINAVIARPYGQLGTRRPANFVITSDAKQIAKILEGKQEPVIKVGNLSAERTFMDVKDTVKGYSLLMDKAQSGEAYNLGGDKLRSIGDYLNMMLEMYDLKHVKIETNPNLLRANDTNRQWPNSDKIRKLGWKQTISIEKTLEEIIEHWRKQV